VIGGKTAIDRRPGLYGGEGEEEGREKKMGKSEAANLCLLYRRRTDRLADRLEGVC